MTSILCLGDSCALATKVAGYTNKTRNGGLRQVLSPRRWTSLVLPRFQSPGVRRVLVRLLDTIHSVIHSLWDYSHPKSAIVC